MLRDGSGISLNIATLLASQGHFVYADARKPEDMATLSTMRNVQGVYVSKGQRR
jgi:NADP-dependent 3-hydroxy acid dehydrogenase YdfG